VLEVYPIPIVLVLVAALIAAVTDVWKFKVYNVLTFPLLASGLLYHLVHGGAAGLAGSFLGALIGFALMIFLYAMGGMGAGDVKFVTALGAWLGVPLTLYVMMAGCIAAGAYSAVLLVVGASWRETALNMQILWLRLVCLGRHLGSEDRVETEVKRPDRRRRLIPFTAMIALGLVATVLWLRSQASELLASPPPSADAHIAPPAAPNHSNPIEAR
jgi:prepilin peptidase CpaA